MGQRRRSATMGRLGAIVVVGAAVLAACTASGGGPSSPTDDIGAGGPSTTTADPTTTTTVGVDEPDPIQWYLVTMCSSVGPVTVEMPGPVAFEGPKDLMRLPPPANGTFAFSYGGYDREPRLDALVIDDAGTPDEDQGSLMGTVVRQIDGAPEDVWVGPVEEVGGHVELDFVGNDQGRDLPGRALAGQGVVFAVSYGYFPPQRDEVRKLGQRQLARMQSSIRFPGLDDGVARPCEGPTQEPIPEPDEASPQET